MKKNKISKNWINRQRRDIYVRKSKIEGYRSRAVYKLEEINQKFKIFHNGISVLDLGAAPGSWTQYISKNYKNIKLAAIDLKKFDEVENTFVEPYLPNYKIGIIHLAAGIWKNGIDMRKDKNVQIEIQTLENKKLLKSLRFID